MLTHLCIPPRRTRTYKMIAMCVAHGLIAKIKRSLATLSRSASICYLGLWELMLKVLYVYGVLGQQRATPRPSGSGPSACGAQVVGHRRHYGGAAIFSSARPAGGSTRRAHGQRPWRRAAHQTALRRTAHSAPVAAQAGRSGGMAAFRRVHWRTCGRA